MNEVAQSSVVAVSSDKPMAVDVKKIRKTGIPAKGSVPWGTHFCQFYQTKEDLIDVLVPYFKAGLESNEFCMWVTSEPLSEKEAEEAMRKAVPDFELYLERGQMEIVPHNEWYLKDGVFNLQRVLNAWINKLGQALANGYDGIRVTGNTAWLEKKDWKDFADYEEEVNSVIGKYRMIAICTYSLDKCGANDVIDVVRNHHFALIKRRAEWELIQSSELKRAKEQLWASEERFRNTLDNMLEGCQIVGYDWRYLYVNEAVAKHGRTTKEKLLGKTMMEMYPGIEKTEAFSQLQRCMKGRISIRLENEFEFPGGEKGWFDLSVQPVPEGIFILSIDITERKEAEEKIKNANEEWMRTFDAISDLVFILDNDSRFVRVNKATCDFLRKEPKELIGKRCFEVLHGTDKPILNCPCEKLKVTRKTETLELLEPNLGLTLLVTASPIVDGKGELIGCVHIAKDITDRKRSEEALQRAEEKFRGIFENVHDVITYVDKHGKILDVNNRVEGLLGYKRDEIIGKQFVKLGLIGLKDIPKMLKLFIGTVRKGEAQELVELELKHKNGSKVFVEIGTRFIKKNGKVESVVNIFRDISGRKKAEKTIRESQEKFERLFMSNPEATVFSDLNDRVLDINPRFTELFGYSPDEAKGQLLDDLIVPDDSKEEAKMLTGITEGYVYHDTVRKSKDGSLIPVSISSASLKLENQNSGNVVQYKDITERKNMYEQLREYSEHLEEKVEERTNQLKDSQEQLIRTEKLAALGELATMVGHDLRNPLQSIENAAYYLNNELPLLTPSLPNPQKTMEMLQAINNSVNYAAKIIRDLQDFSATKTPILKKANINNIVRDTLQQNQTPNKVELRTEMGSLPEIEVDEDQIKRVSMNLTVNGIQAMENGGGTLTVSTKQTEGFVEITFKDTGEGISKENLQKIFTPLFTTKAKGMGMGLPICKKFVENHGGTINVESQVGKGTTVTVKLPIPKKQRR